MNQPQLYDHILRWLVPSASRPEETHLVDLGEDPSGHQCSCEDHTIRKRRCRHITAVREHLIDEIIKHEKIMSDAMSPTGLSSSALLGVSRSINGRRMAIAAVGVPALANGCPELCEGCGEPKRHLGREASGFVACNKCVRKLKWLNDARTGPELRTTAVMWENRMAVVLMWMREAAEPEPEDVR